MTCRPQDLVAAALEAGAPLLTQAGVFDVYRDERRLGAGRVSLAIRLVFQDPERTLTEDEASAVRERVVAALRRPVRRRAAQLAWRGRS